jgi:nitrogen fixation-related uncharacterized protein
MIFIRARKECYPAPGDDRAKRYKPQVTVKTEETGTEALGGFEHSKRYVMKVSLGVYFWANTAQYSDAYRNAEKQIMDTAYGDVLTAIHETRTMLYAQDLEAALHRLDRLEQDILG